MRGLTRRQPIVVSSSCALRPNGVSALAITKGARLMLSTPPASISSASPARMARAALPTASSPEPHRRLSVLPGTDTGSPASSALMRATLRLSSPAWLAQPYSTSATASQSRSGWRCINARSGTAPSSSVRTLESAPA
jgi:hypothetical protein